MCVLGTSWKKKWNKLYEMKEDIRKVVVGSDFFFQETTKKGHTDETQVSLGTTALLLCLEVPSE